MIARSGASQARVGIAWVLLEEVSGLKFWDPKLTKKGWEQAEQRRQQLQEEQPPFHIDAVVSSPFRRTLQTAYGTIPHLHARGSRQVSVVATDLLRESIHNFTCDGRSRVSTLRQEFPAVDFQEVSEEDVLFWTGKEQDAVGRARLRQRTLEAAKWILSRPSSERSIAVVSHRHFLDAFIFHLTGGKHLSCKSLGRETYSC